MRSSYGHLRFDRRLSAWKSFFCLSLFLLQYRTQHHRNVNAMPLQHNRGDKTRLELFCGEVAAWTTEIAELLASA
jgi:hypothetical protein